MRILVVEDERKLNKLISDRLKLENYSVDSCLDGADVEHFLNCAEYDSIILDIMLPNVTGLEILKSIRLKGNKNPVLLLTALDSIDDRVKGLDLGADDYLVKPFSFEELLARVRVLVRRGHGDVTDIFKIADLTIDYAARKVCRNNENIELTSKEFAILEYLARNSGIVLSRDKIGRHVWNYDYEGGSNVVDVYVRYLRKKIDDNSDVKLLHTVRGTGYVLREEK